MSLFDFMKPKEKPTSREYQLGIMYGRLRQRDPKMADMWLAQVQQQQSQAYLGDVMGNKAVPQLVQPYELSEAERFGDEKIPGLKDITQYAQPGSGYLGGDMSDKELAFRLMQAPTSQTRQVGGTLLQQLLQPKAPRAETAIEFFQRDPRAFSQYQTAQQGLTTAERNLQAAGFNKGTSPYQNKMLDILMKPQTQISMGSVPAGYERKPDSTGQGDVIAPQKGSKDYNLAEQKYLNIGQGVAEADEMIGLIKKHGSELYGPTSKTMSQLYLQLQSRIAEAQNKGVLQAGEIETIARAMSDPSSVDASFTRNDSMIAGYRKLQEILMAKQEMLGRQFLNWGYELPKSTGQSSRKRTAADVQAEIDELKRELGR